MWLSVDPLAEQTMQPYSYANNNPINLTDPTGMETEDGCPSCGFNASIQVGFGSNGLTIKLNVSAGISANSGNAQGVLFAGASIYAGDQVGTSSTGRAQFDITAGGYATLGSGQGNRHTVNTLNPDTPSGVANSFKNSITYGQMITYSSGINAERGPNDEGGFQRLGMAGIRIGDVSFTTSNDTRYIGGDNGDRGQTGNGTINIGGDRGFSLSYTNYTGTYDTKQNGIGYGNYYNQTPYQQSLNKSAFRADIGGVGGIPSATHIGGKSNGSVQNAIHSVTNTGLFRYSNKIY